MSITLYILRNSLCNIKLYAEAEVRVDVGGEGEAGEVGAADSYRRS